METYIIEAWVLGEQVTLYHRPASLRMVDEWMKENEERLTGKGFSGFEIHSYRDDE